MFLIRAFIGASAIHGNGVFAGEEIAPGTVVWRYEPNFDRVISDEELAGMPDAFCDYINMYAYRSSDIGGRLLLPCDHAKFLNHSADPNTTELPLKSVARRLIQIGEEITCDYSKFCVDWTGFDQVASSGIVGVHGDQIKSLAQRLQGAKVLSFSQSVNHETAKLSIVTSAKPSKCLISQRIKS